MIVCLGTSDLNDDSYKLQVEIGLFLVLEGGKGVNVLSNLGTLKSVKILWQSS